jgi:hypothetical protein
MLERAYVGSGRSWLRRDKKSGSTAIAGIGEGSLSSSRDRLGFDSACKCAQRSPNMVTARSSRAPGGLFGSRRSTRSVTSIARRAWSLYAAAAASTRRRRSRIRSSLRSRTRRIVDRERDDLSAAGLDGMSDSTGGWYNLIGNSFMLASIRRDEWREAKKDTEKR